MTGFVPVLEVGGSHVTAALVDPAGWTLPRPPARVELDPNAAAEPLLAAFARAAAEAGAAGPDWAVAMPDPFDYERGIARFRGVGKFDSLDGIDVRADLLARLPGATRVGFVNDADAFALGEWVAGAARGTARMVGITLGTGVGSGWIDDGRIADPGVPRGGRAHLLTLDGRPLEDLMSRRAVRAAYARATGTDADVRQIAEAARGGESAAVQVLAFALRSLGRALAAPLRDFAPDLVVLGGSMSRSWHLFEPWFREGAGLPGLPPTAVAADADHAGLIGAAYAVRPAATDR